MQILVILLTCFVSSLHPYNILVFNPRFGKSHVLFMNTITDTLIEAGHNLVSLQ
ncbi:unnamed protein product [Thelazia callipaeda]|uniref:Glucuronosyltransferase n=1 Tax=Thelazia callipaeda TaxID=103827 RepID=A0A0N5DCD0_THECL|nr:unnamed protein product [Thelazia callipaeda]